ncbi:MAG: flagellar basal body P-ring biosynthesis protein FlgA [marine bacterium B5-7]|nr:MAG: flagellar basal body P-ring biosynthesis protein FlgA [marine bacterium B5-7]
MKPNNLTSFFMPKLLTLLVITALSTSVYSKEYHSLKDISRTAHDFILNQIQTLDEEIQINVGKLDPRLSLHRCTMPLEAFTQGYETRQGRSTVGVRCSDHKPWSLYVPITIKNFKQVVILKQTASRNTVLTEADLSFEKVNINRLSSGYFRDMNQVQGKILTQNLSKGAVLTNNHIKIPMAINRGQRVTLIAKNAVIEVRAEGKAMSKGAIGERIKVKNMKTKRIVEGIIIDKYLINVNL